MKTITAAAANVIEGKSGDTAQLRFEVRLSEAAAQDVTFFAKTADNAKATNAAKAGQDYVALSNTEFTIEAGDTSALSTLTLWVMPSRKTMRSLTSSSPPPSAPASPRAPH
ncbi:MAG: hypothetical protein IPG16_22955 [Comamonadaceae bacterium]|nr:hypothetical protein [Comamonadaceae bacterium]